MNEVIRISLNRNTVKVYEQTMNDDSCYTAYLITNKKKYFLDDFDSLTEATLFSIQYCIDN